MGEKRLCGVTPEGGNVLGNILFQPERPRSVPGKVLKRRGKVPAGPHASSTGASHRRGCPSPPTLDKGHISRNWPQAPGLAGGSAAFLPPPRLGRARLPLCSSSPQNSRPRQLHAQTRRGGRTVKSPLTSP